MTLLDCSRDEVWRAYVARNEWLGAFPGLRPSGLCWLPLQAPAPRDVKPRVVLTGDLPGDLLGDLERDPRGAPYFFDKSLLFEQWAVRFGGADPEGASPFKADAVKIAGIFALGEAFERRPMAVFYVRSSPDPARDDACALGLTRARFAATVLDEPGLSAETLRGYIFEHLAATFASRPPVK